MSDQPEPTPGTHEAGGADRDRVLDDPEIDGAATELEATPPEDLAARLDAGERLHQALTERLSQTGRGGG